MATDLPIWQFNTKAWIEENGLTSKEWIQYKNNLRLYGIVLYIGAFISGYLLGGV